MPSYGVGKALFIKASGVVSTTGTPSLNLGITADATLGTALANLTLGTAGVVAVTGSTAFSASGLSNIPWELDVQVTCATTGSSATFYADGTVKYYTASTTYQAVRISSSASNPNTTITLSTLSAYYWELSAIWSAASSSDSIQVYSYIVMGLN
jgi:hypothetical protein